jgi:D,D-heptose 1,7-bisphosphate phosphatase
MNKAFFIDRDGTINKYIPYINNIDDFELIEGVSEAIRLINQSKWLVIVVTNQPQVAKGLLLENDVNKMHDKMTSLLSKDNAKIDGIYYCPHSPPNKFKNGNKDYQINCSCRKPKSGLYMQAQKDFNIDFSSSVFIGDTTRDIAVTKDIGGKSILLKCGLGGKDNKFPITPDHYCKNLLDAAKTILKK